MQRDKEIQIRNMIMHVSQQCQLQLQEANLEIQFMHPTFDFQAADANQSCY
jgi:hypothetical protein